jgi:hypothetical protein
MPTGSPPMNGTPSTKTTMPFLNCMQLSITGTNARPRSGLKAPL